MKRCIIVFIIFALCCCKTKKDSKTDGDDVSTAKATYTVERNIVDTIILRKRNFNKEVLSNGKLRAERKSVLRFLGSGELEEVLVTNGQNVAKGQLLATLNKREAQIRLDQARKRMDRAEIDLKEALLGFGYGYDTTKVPHDLLVTAYTRSGYLSSRGDLELAEITFSNTSLRAPFAGKVANIKSKAYERIADDFCTLIDDKSFEVDFNLLESEIPFIKNGQKVNISLFNSPDKSYSGRVTQINPLVDEKGQINIMAQVPNSDGKLMEGMNIKVMIQDVLPSQLVVPKGAVVIRDNQEVLFRYGNDNKAMWTYVNVLMSNSREHVVSANRDKGAELNVGDVIIISGNLNLGDGSDIEIGKRK